MKLLDEFKSLSLSLSFYSISHVSSYNSTIIPWKKKLSFKFLLSIKESQRDHLSNLLYFHQVFVPFYKNLNVSTTIKRLPNYKNPSIANRKLKREQDWKIGAQRERIYGRPSRVSRVRVRQ